MTRRAFGGIALLLCAAVSAQATMVRTFAVGSKLDLRDADSYTDFRDKMFALVDAQHPRRDELVQGGAGDVASHLLPADAAAPALALVVFPEDVGLIAGLIGSRGAPARTANIHNGGATVAFAALIQAYDPQIQHYMQLYPDLPVVRYLLLAETDTFYRAVYETFRDLARTYHVYLTANVNVPAARRVDSQEDAALVALLRDPDEAAMRDYAYVALSPDVYNTTFIFDPDGNVLVAAPDGSVLRSPVETGGVLRGSLNKVYLTEDEQVTLPLSGGRVQDLDVIATPVGRLASVISKDAWMPDVNDRYEAKGANIILQPEAFSEWAYVADPWQPDGFKAGGFAQVQRNPHFIANVAACMTGNLFEITFDGQSAIIGKRRKGGVPPLSVETAWIGQNADSGFRAVAPWIVDDPGIADPLLSLATRRMQLADAGAHLLPGTHPACASATVFGACENGYRESIIFSDVDIPVSDAELAPIDTGPRVPTSFGASAQVTGANGVAHEYGRVAARAGTVYVAWQDDRVGLPNVYLAKSIDRGAHFTEQHVSDNPPGTVHELRPAIGIDRLHGDVWVAWQEFCDGGDDDCGRIKLAHFDAGGTKVQSDIRVDRGSGEAGKWNPALAVTRGGAVFISWVDERDRGPGALQFEHIYAARVQRNGTVGPNARVDRGVPVADAAALDNKWAPAVAVHGRRAYVAWTDFRNYNWDIFSAHTRDGVRYSTNVRVDDFPDFERIHDHPSIAIDDHGVAHAVWADRRDTAADTNVFYARSRDGGRHFETNRQIDASMLGFNPNRDTPSNQWNPRLAVDGADVFAVWQDNRQGNNDIFIVHSADGGAIFDLDERVDDSGDGPSNQYRPDLAIDDSDPSGRQLYVVWDDDRNGTLDVYLAHKSLP